MDLSEKRPRRRRPQLPTGFYVACPHCAEELRIHGKFLGARTQCKLCSGQFDFDLANPQLTVVAVYTNCPHCVQEVRAASRYLGKGVACRHCDKPFQLARVGLKSAIPSVGEKSGKGLSAAELDGPAEIHDLSELDFSFVDAGHTDRDDGVVGLDDSAICDAEEKGWFDEPEDDWYCKILGQTMGPMSLAALRQLARDEQLASDDPVRCGGNSEWQPAMIVASLLADLLMHDSIPAIDGGSSDTGTEFIGDQSDETDFQLNETLDRPEEIIDVAVQSATDESTFELEVPFLPTPKTRANEATAESDTTAKDDNDTTGPALPVYTPTSQPSPDADYVHEAESALLDSAENVARESRKPPRPVKTASSAVRPYFRHTIAIGVGLVGAILISAIVWHFASKPSSSHEHYRQLVAISGEVRALRDRRAADSEWQELQQRATPQVQSIVRDLAETARAKSPASQSMLWAARDHLLPMLSDPRNEAGENEKAFDRHMQDAAAYLAGRDPDAR